MKLFFFSFVTLLSAIFNTTPCMASCEIGPVLFRDTLYGSAIGAGVGALIVLANTNTSTSNIAPTIATSTLIGVGAGLVAGVAELSYSNCSSKSRKKHEDENDLYSFNFKPMVTVVDNKVNQPSIQQSFSNFSLNQIGCGLTLEYSLN